MAKHDTATGAATIAHEPAHETAAPAPAAAAAPETVAVELGGVSVPLPRKFMAGPVVLTANQALILDAAYQRQFKNNQDANAKARAEAYAKATTDEARADKAPLTAEQYIALYRDYEPAVGGAPRLGSMEKLRQEAGWRFWVGHVAEHNKLVAAGQTGLIAKAQGKQVALLRAPTKAETKLATGLTGEALDKAHKEALDTFNTGTKPAFVSKLLAFPMYAEGVQIALDAIMAERGASKAKEATVTVDTVSSDDLF